MKNISSNYSINIVQLQVESKDKGKYLAELKDVGNQAVYHTPSYLPFKEMKKFVKEDWNINLPNRADIHFEKNFRGNLETFLTPNEAPKAENTYNDAFYRKFDSIYSKWYQYLYKNNDKVKGYTQALDVGEMWTKDTANKPVYKKIVQTIGDVCTSDRQLAALAFALNELGVI